MTKEQILKKSIEIVAKYGYKIPVWINDTLLQLEQGFCVNNIFYETFVFQHEFCKAMAKYILKSNQATKLNIYTTQAGGWTQRLILEKIERQFKIESVLSEDRLEYMEQFVKE